jgi:hypothetical protein
MPYQGVIFVGPSSASRSALAGEIEKQLPEASTAHDAFQVRVRFDDGFTLIIRQVMDDVRDSIASDAERSGQIDEPLPQPLAAVWEIASAGTDPAMMHFDDYLAVVNAVLAAHPAACHWDLVMA